MGCLVLQDGSVLRGRAFGAAAAAAGEVGECGRAGGRAPLPSRRGLPSPGAGPVGAQGRSVLSRPVPSRPSPLPPPPAEGRRGRAGARGMCGHGGGRGPPPRLGLCCPRSVPDRRGGLPRGADRPLVPGADPGAHLPARRQLRRAPRRGRPLRAEPGEGTAASRGAESAAAKFHHPRARVGVRRHAAGGGCGTMPPAPGTGQGAGAAGAPLCSGAGCCSWGGSVCRAGVPAPGAGGQSGSRPPGPSQPLGRPCPQDRVQVPLQQLRVSPSPRCAAPGPPPGQASPSPAPLALLQFLPCGGRVGPSLLWLC